MESETKHYTAYAKINLCLAITGIRHDGYHLLDMVNVEIGLSDRLSFHSTSIPGVRLMCNDPRIPLGEDNLIQRAIKKYADAGKIDDIRLHIELEKSIPSGGGLGGGSMDAAASLRYLQDTYQALSDEKLVEVATSIGADVPFGLMGGAARVKGIGDELEPLAPRQTDPVDSSWIVLLAPAIHSDTRTAYQAWDRDASHITPTRNHRSPHNTEAVAEAVRERRWAQLDELIFNDLQEPVFKMIPRLLEIHTHACSIFQRPVFMTGSGSNLFALFPSEVHAKSFIDRWDDDRFSIAPALYPLLI